MADLEKVIKGLEVHIKPNSRCVGCPYPNNGLCGDQLYHDALILLKEQEDMIQIHSVADWLARYAVPPSKTSLDHAEMVAAWTKFLKQFKE